MSEKVLVKLTNQSLRGGIKNWYFISFGLNPETPPRPPLKVWPRQFFSDNDFTDWRRPPRPPFGKKVKKYQFFYIDVSCNVEFTVTSHKRFCINRPYCSKAINGWLVGWISGGPSGAPAMLINKCAQLRRCLSRVHFEKI